MQQTLEHLGTIKVDDFQTKAREVFAGDSFRGDIGWDFEQDVLHGVPNLVACRKHQKKIFRLNQDMTDSELKSFFGDSLVQKASPWLASMIYRIQNLNKFSEQIENNTSYLEYIKIGFWIFKKTLVIEYYRQGGHWTILRHSFDGAVRLKNRNNMCVVVN